MDAKRVLAVLRQFEFQCGCFPVNETFPCSTPHKEGCSLAALITEAEQEAREGGWKPGTEPPNIARVVVIRFHVTDSYGGVALVEAKGLRSLDGWRRVDLFGNCYPVQVIEWRELSPLPEAA